MTLDFNPAPIAVPQPVLDDLRERLAPHAPSEPARRRRLADGHRARVPRDAARVLEGLVRLARAGGALQRVRTDGDRSRRPAHPLPARALAGTRRVAAAHLARLARFGHGVPRRARPALESARARRRSRRRLPRGRAVASRLRVLRSHVTSADGTRAAWRKRSRRSCADLGYDRYGAQGGDWGSIVSQNVADLDPEHVCGLHLNFITVPRPDGRAGTHAGGAAPSATAVIAFRTTGAGYQEIQGTKPQTVGYSLEDSPSGLCAWIVEKFTAWTDCDGDVEREFTKDQLLTNITVYWATATATSSARLYYEMRQAGRERDPARRTWACPPAWRTTPARSPARRGRGPSTATTSPTGPTSRTAGTSRRCRCPTSSWPTSGSSSAPSAEHAGRARVHRAVQRNNLGAKPTPGGSHGRARRGRQQFEATMGGFSDEAGRRRAGERRAPGRCTCERAAACPVPAQPERHHHAAADGRHPHRQPQPRRRAGQQVPREQPQGDPARARRPRAHEVPPTARPGVHGTRASRRSSTNIRKLANELIDGFVDDGEVNVNQAVVPAAAVDDLPLDPRAPARRPRDRSCGSRT